MSCDDPLTSDDILGEPLNQVEIDSGPVIIDEVNRGILKNQKQEKSEWKTISQPRCTKPLANKDQGCSEPESNEGGLSVGYFHRMSSPLPNGISL